MSESMTLAEITERLLARDPLPPLTPTQVYDPSLTMPIDDSDAPDLVKAGLHLLNDDLARAHPIAQAQEGDPTADYWHAIIHRREGDFGNSGYWFRRVGTHPILTETYGPDSAPIAAFVAACRAAGTAPAPQLQAQQQTEMARLLAFASNREDNEGLKTPR